MLKIALFGALALISFVRPNAFTPKFVVDQNQTNDQWDRSILDFFEDGANNRTQPKSFGEQLLEYLTQIFFKKSNSNINTTTIDFPWYSRDNVCVHRSENITEMDPAAQWIPYKRRICTESLLDRLCITSIINETHVRTIVESYECCENHTMSSDLKSCVPIPDLEKELENTTTFELFKPLILESCGGHNDTPCTVFLPKNAANWTDQLTRAHIVPNSALYPPQLAFVSAVKTLDQSSGLFFSASPQRSINCEPLRRHFTNGSLSVFEVDKPLKPSDVTKTVSDYLFSRPDLSEFADAFNKSGSCGMYGTVIAATNDQIQSMTEWDQIKSNPARLRTLISANRLLPRLCSNSGDQSDLFSDEVIHPIFVTNETGSFVVHEEGSIRIAESDIHLADGTVHIADHLIQPSHVKSINTLLIEMGRKDIVDNGVPVNDTEAGFRVYLPPAGHSLPTNDEHERNAYFEPLANHLDDDDEADDDDNESPSSLRSFCFRKLHPNSEICAWNGHLFPIPSLLPTLHENLSSALEAVTKQTNHNLSIITNLLNNMTDSQIRLLNHIRGVTFLIPIDSGINQNRYAISDFKSIIKYLILNSRVCSGKETFAQNIWSLLRFVHLRPVKNDDGSISTYIGNAKVLLGDLVTKQGIVHIVDKIPGEE